MIAASRSLPCPRAVQASARWAPGPNNIIVKSEIVPGGTVTAAQAPNARRRPRAAHAARIRRVPARPIATSTHARHAPAGRSNGRRPQPGGRTATCAESRLSAAALLAASHAGPVADEPGQSVLQGSDPGGIEEQSAGDEARGLHRSGDVERAVVRAQLHGAGTVAPGAGEGGRIACRRARRPGAHRPAQRARRARHPRICSTSTPGRVRILIADATVKAQINDLRRKVLGEEE